MDKVVFPAILLCIAGHILQTSAPQRCTNATQIDLCFLIDGSGSICDSDPKFDVNTDNTCDNWSFIVSFVYRFVTDLYTGPKDVRVAIVTFDTTASLKCNLTSHLDQNRLLDTINTTLKYRTGGETDTSGGLNLMAIQVFNAVDRPKALRTAIIITDGKPTNYSTVPAAISRVHSLNITTFVIGITNSVDDLTLAQLSSPPQKLGETYFKVSDFRTIDTFRYLVLNKTCLLPTTATPSTTSTTTTTTSTTSRTTISNPITKTTFTTPTKTTDSNSTPRDGRPLLEIGLGIGVTCGVIIIVLVIIILVLCVEIRSLRKFKREIQNNNQSLTNAQQVANGTAQLSLNHYQQLSMQNPQQEYERINRYDTSNTIGTETTGHYETPIN